MSLGTAKDQAYAERDDAAREDDGTDPEKRMGREWKGALGYELPFSHRIADASVLIPPVVTRPM
jgi:hypothetical protein